MDLENTSESVARDVAGLGEESPIETISSSLAWESRWYRIRRDEVRFPDGSFGEFNIVEHPGAVWIIPVTTGGDIVLLRHYRYTVDDWCWEIPAGGVKKGLSLVESALEELEEEIGGKPGAMAYVGWFYTSNGITNEVAHVFLATDVHLGETRHESSEVMEVHTKAIPLVLDMAHKNETSDGPSALAILLCETKLVKLSA